MDKVTIRLDQHQHNADWTKERWDLPRDAAGFLTTLGIDPGDRMSYAHEAVERFMAQKPAAKFMPNELRQELAARQLLFGVRAEPHYRATVDKVEREVVGALRVRKSKGGKTRYFLVNKTTGLDGIRIDPDTLEPMT